MKLLNDFMVEHYKLTINKYIHEVRFQHISIQGSLDTLMADFPTFYTFQLVKSLPFDIPEVTLLQRLHLRCVSCRAKSSLCRQQLKYVQKSGRMSLKNGVFPVLDRFRVLRSRSEMSQFFIPTKFAPFDDRPDD